MMMCIVSGGGSCPQDQNDWSSAAVLIAPILAITAYKGFKQWLCRRYPLPDDDVTDG